MTKAILKKVRKGDENIGKLIVFAVTIIIAVGVLGTLAYFYNQSRQNATQLSTLTSTTSSSTDLNTLGFCSTADNNYVKYDPVDDRYGLFCGGTADSTKVKEVRGIVNVNTTSPTSGTLSGADLTFEVNR